MSNGTGSGMLFFAAVAASDSRYTTSEAFLAFCEFPSAHSLRPVKYPCALSAAAPCQPCFDLPMLSRSSVAISSSTLDRLWYPSEYVVIPAPSMGATQLLSS